MREDVIGSGGFGTVYQVTLNEKDYALKCCDFQKTAIYEKIDKEIEINQKISKHPNILYLYKAYKWEKF